MWDCPRTSQQSEGREGAGVSTLSYTTAVTRQPYGQPYGLNALRVRGVRYWWAALGFTVLVFPSFAAVAVAIRQPAPARAGRPLPTLSLPAVQFPMLRVPKLQRLAPLPPLHHPSAAIPSATTASPKLVRRRVPILTNTYSSQPPSTSTAAAQQYSAAAPAATAAIPPPTAPVVESTVGTPVDLMAAATAAGQEPGVLEASVGASPLFPDTSTSTPSPAATPAASPAAAVPADPSVATDSSAVVADAAAPTSVYAAPLVNVDEVVTTAVVGASGTDTDTASAPAGSSPTDPTATTTSATTTQPGPTGQPDDTTGTQSVAGTAGAAGTSGSSGSGGTPSGLSPPVAGAWNVTLTDANAHDITLGLVGGNVQISVNGSLLGTRAPSLVTAISIVGAPDVNDTLTVDFSGGAIAAPISFDGGPGGYDALVIAGHPNSSVSTPTGLSSGKLVVDGTAIAYTGLEDPDVSAADITINGGEDGNASPIPQGDKFVISPYTDGSITATCATPGNCIQVQNFDSTGTLLSVLNYFVISGTTKLTINGGPGTDKTEFTGNFIAPGIDLTINTESIKINSGVTVSAHNVNFNAAEADDGFDFLGIATTLLGDTASIELDSAILNGATVDLEASATNAQTTVDSSGGAQTLTGVGNTLIVKTTTPFLSAGQFTIPGVTGTCTYTGTSNRNQFTGISGCTGTPADGALVSSVGIIEGGSTTGFEHSALQLIYGASINVHGNSSITATGDVTLASTVNVTGTANGQPVNWVSSKDYKKDDVVVDGGKNFSAKADIAAVDDTTAPHLDSTHWQDATGQNAAVAASSLVATATSQLSGMSTISASAGNVKITSSLKTNITTIADATLSGSGAGIAIAVVVTDSEAFVDSTAAIPVLALSLLLSADTANAAPTTGTASPGGSSSGGSGTDANSPSSAVPTSESSKGNDAAKKGDNQSKSSDGNQGVAAALGVTVLVATTQAYIASASGSAVTISTSGGTQTIQASAANNAAATADAGNVKFSPDAPKGIVSTLSGSLAPSQSLYYKVTALSVSNRTTVSGPGQNLLLGSLKVADASGFDAAGKFNGTGITGVCSYTSVDSLTNTLLGVTGCTGTPADAAAVTELQESLPSPETKVDIPDGSPTNSVALTWGAVPNATAYEIYRSTATGTETLLAGVTSPSYNDDGTAIPGTATPPTEDTKSGVGIAVGVTVAVVNTKAYVGNGASLVATTVTVQTLAPSPSAYSATAISGAGGSSVGVAGSIAVLVVVNNTTTDVEGTTPSVAVNGADVTLNAASNLTNTALATAKQASDGNTSGVGASFALNVVNDTTISGLPASSTITSAKSLTINATDTDASSTTANGGAAAGSGSLALSAQVAITLANVTTSATVAPGPDLTLTGGGLTAKATQNASSKTIATGSAKGGSATIGLSLSLAIINDLVDSQLERNLTAGGAVSFTANGVSSNDTEATASSAGAPGKKNSTQGSDDGATNPKDGTSEGTVNQKADKNLSLANDKSTSSGGKDSGTSSTPAAKSGEGGGTSVTVAAAAAIAMITAHAISGIPDGLLTLSTPTGAASFNTTEDADSTAKANGSASNGSSANIGAAAAINLIKIQNTATIGAGDIVDSSGLTLSAIMPGAVTGVSDGKNTFDTEATAGAGKGKVGIAGSLALTIADVVTNVEIKANSTRGPPDNITGALSLTAVSSVSSTTKAMAKDTDAGTVGIGAGAAINSVNDVTTALIDDGAVISGVTNVTLSASSNDSQTTYAEAGASGGSGSDLAFTADAAISLPTVITTASIAGDTTQTLTASGAITLTAKQTASATTTAKADATTGDVVIGLALALAVPDDEVTATDSRTISGTAISFSATGQSSTTTEADASAAGAKGDSGSGDGSGKDVNGKADQQLSSANGESASTTGKSSKTTDTSNAQATTSDKNSSGGNTVTVAGAAAINVVVTSYQATLADSAHVTATGLLSLKTSANTDASAVGSGKTTDAGTVGIGVGVAVEQGQR